MQEGSNISEAVTHVLLSNAVLCYFLETAEGILKRVVGSARSHVNTAAGLSASLPVGRAVETILGIPKWQELLQPLLLACLVCLSVNYNRIRSCLHPTCPSWTCVVVRLSAGSMHCF
jgi:hypothetical protein